MKDKKEDILKKLKVPWLTKDGFVDLAKFPIDSILKKAISEKEQDFRSSCRTLVSMYVSGRTEAAIFLYGLLVYNEDDIFRKEAIVEALGHVETKESANLLFRELQHIVSSNSTRSYINTILRSLKYFPLEYVKEGFEELLNDKKWSYRMKRKFRDILEKIEYRY